MKAHLARAARATAPLAVAPAAAPVPVRRGAGSLVALPIGAIAGCIRALEISADGRRVTYELLVANETPLPLATFAYGAGALAPGELVSWRAISVPPLSSVALAIDVPHSRTRARRMVAELHAAEAHLRLDADPPNVHPRGRARRVAIGATAAMLFGLGAAAYAAGRPHVAALAAPVSVDAGKTFSVAYAFGALDAGTYDVETPDGAVVQRGDLRSPSGAFAVTLPGTRPAGGYDVRVVARNRLGEDVRVAHVLALAPPAETPRAHRAGVAPARIASLSLERDAVGGGEPIVVDYATDATVGTVRLFDQDGTLRGEALVNPRGSSIVLAPHVDADQDFRIVLHVARGTSQAEANVPVRVRAADGENAHARPEAAPSSRAESLAAGPIALPPGEFVSGETVDVGIVRHERALHVGLVAPNGEELESIDVPGDRSTLALPAPDVAAPSKFLVVATFARGVGQETVVHEIVVRPRPVR